ncbi:probable RNA-binding protein EIF1AD [Euwallacea fornicatus]|uniref:probable RNA-binding protein EIF1AD n=1 Tax=Euwallacea fornicatus TaxID=995702 RepID=UPI00338D7D26
MSRIKKYKHICRNEEFSLPGEHHQVVRILDNKGNNLHQAETPDGCTFLVFLPPKFRRLMWIRTGSYVLVERIENDDKVKAEITKICSPEFIKYLMEHNAWPNEFEVAGCKNSTLSKTEDAYMFVNTNYPEDSQSDSSGESESDSSDESDTENSDGQEYAINEDSESDSKTEAKPT